MQIDYTHYEQDKQTSQDMNANEKAKTMAREIVGDGQTPNLWFVTYGPYVAIPDEDGYDFELIEGYDSEDDGYTSGPFTSYEAALTAYNKIELSFDYGVGQAFIEDRECGIVTEKWLYKRVRTEYLEDEYDNSKRFYKK